MRSQGQTTGLAEHLRDAAMIFNTNVPAEPQQTPAERLDNLRKVAEQMQRECTELFYRDGISQEMMSAINQLKALRSALHDAHAKRESSEQAETARRLKVTARCTAR